MTPPWETNVYRCAVSDDFVNVVVEECGREPRMLREAHGVSILVIVERLPRAATDDEPREPRRILAAVTEEIRSVYPFMGRAYAAAAPRFALSGQDAA